ncbi:MAG: 2-C-methyl-D-erythritol 4-phosphate cytidylyltransferase [Acidimicrobiales bacterium]
MLLAAGRSERFGTSKQTALLAGRRVLDWSLAAVRSVATGVVLVEPPEGLATPPAQAEQAEQATDFVTVGGSTRSESVRAGLAKVPQSAQIVVVHDAARPLASPQLFRAVVERVLAGAAGAVPGIPITDTLKRIEQGRVAGTLDRRDLVAVQTPQAFEASALRRAHATLGGATDDAALVEALELVVAVVPGEPANLKITRPFDLELAELLVTLRAEARPGTPRTGSWHSPQALV